MARWNRTKNYGWPTAPHLKIQAQMCNQILGALIDTGSTRSVISHEQFKLMQRANSGLSIMPVVVHCVTASGQSLRILGEVVILVKIEGFTWKFPYLVSQRLWGPPILGMDFMIKTQLVLDVAGRVILPSHPRLLLN